LSGHKSNIDLLLNTGGVVYMPYTFLIDWTTLALGVFGLGLIALIHGTVVLIWSITLQMIGLCRSLGLPGRLALGLTLVNTVVIMPLRIIFAW
jgi:hypothetical protein